MHDIGSCCVGFLLVLYFFSLICFFFYAFLAGPVKKVELVQEKLIEILPSLMEFCMATHFEICAGLLAATINQSSCRNENGDFKSSRTSAYEP